MPSATEFVAFRVDDRHVVAVLAETSNAGLEQTSFDRIAQYGFTFENATPAAAAAAPATVSGLPQWTIHLGSGRHARATSVRLVQGAPSCTVFVGTLLRIDDASAAAFAAVREKYYVAEPQRDLPRSAPRAATAPPPIDSGQLETLLDGVLARELPGVLKDAEEEIARHEASDGEHQRSWARGRRELQAALAAGRARLRYDVQAFQLERGGPPRYFVRAEWRVGSTPAFGAAVWITGGATLALGDVDLAPARWLTMFEFQGDVAREHYGLVLNVFDRDGDGWSEILFARGGYEAMHLQVMKLTPTGFVPAGIGYSFGC